MLGDDPAGRILTCVCLALIAIVFCALYYPAAWDECRRVHPAWYCAAELGK